jgi:hypothetical protein
MGAILSAVSLAPFADGRSEAGREFSIFLIKTHHLVSLKTKEREKRFTEISGAWGFVGALAFLLGLVVVVAVGQG